MRLENYYLLKCFSQEKYRENFNTGKNVYINSLEYYDKLENSFQQDEEGMIFKQQNNEEAHIIFGSEMFSNELLEKLKADGHRVNSDISIDDILCLSKVAGSKHFLSENFKFRFCGYISCFYLIPKSYLLFKDNKIIFNPKYNFKDEFYCFLNEYCENDKYCYVSVYDAKPFVDLIIKSLKENDFDYVCSPVKYEDLSFEQRIMLYVNKNFKRLVFTKNKSYKYQNEFRIFISNKAGNSKDHLEFHGEDLRKTVVKNFAYLTTTYIKNNIVTKED